MTGSTARSSVAELERFLARLSPLGTERASLAESGGRVLAEPLVADRDSPAHDVSAMDGYAVRLADLSEEALRVMAEAPAGSEPPPMPDGGVVRIFTGACVPEDADAVIRREDVEESGGSEGVIRLSIAAESVGRGQNIRRRGENLEAGELVVDAGEPLDASTTSALAGFGSARPLLHLRVRLGVLVTGDELLPVDGVPEPWQVRDSNGPALQTMFARVPWIEWVGVDHVRDDPDDLAKAARALLERCDAVLLTGGVSMGDRDYVPDVIRAVGGETVFHRLPIRPGRPLLAAVGPEGQAILGLPGNPVSVMVCARRFALPALRRRAGFSRATPIPASVRLVNPDDNRLPLRWFRPARLVEAGAVELTPWRSSGDLVGAARSDGFVELPPGETGEGPWAFWPWSLG